jgi:hypothetical protein
LKVQLVEARFRASRARGMMAAMDTHLTPDELDSLRALLRPLQPIIAAEHEKRLMELGLIEQVFGGLKVTAKGHLRLKAGK